MKLLFEINRVENKTSQINDLVKDFVVRLRQEGIEVMEYPFIPTVEKVKQREPVRF